MCCVEFLRGSLHNLAIPTIQYNKQYLRYYFYVVRAVYGQKIAKYLYHTTNDHLALNSVLKWDPTGLLLARVNGFLVIFFI